MSHLKLLIITNRYPAHADDGASPFVADFVAGLRRNDIDCTILTPNHQADKYDDDNQIVRFDWGETKLNIGSLPKMAPSSWLKIKKYVTVGQSEAIRLHQEHNFDYCLALWAAPSGLFAKKLYDKYNLPYAVWCLGSDIHTYAKLPLVGSKIVKVLKSADVVYSDGRDLGRQAQKLSGRQYQFLPSMRRATIPDDVNQTGCHKRFVCPGRVEKSKGVYDLLASFRRISAQFPDWKLTFIGDGGVRSELERRIKKYGLQDKVNLTGFVPREKMWRLISESDAVIIPTHADSLPLTFGEAIQLKRPVIVTDIGDLRYFTERYRVGLVVPAKNRSYLTKAMIRFCTNDWKPDENFDGCAAELDIDRAADRFADALKGTTTDNVTTGKVPIC